MIHDFQQEADRQAGDGRHRLGNYPSSFKEGAGQMSKAKSWANRSGKLVARHPWVSVGLAVAAGVALGIWVKRL